MSQEFLRRNKDDQVLRAVLHHALASQTRIDARVYGAVNEVLFFVADFWELVFALQHVYVACAAATYTTTVVLKLNTVVEGNVQYRLAFGGYMGLGGLAVLKLEGNIDSFHKGIFKRGKNKGTKVRTPAPDSKLLGTLVVYIDCRLLLLNTVTERIIQLKPLRIRS